MSATHKKNIKKMALKCYSMELFSGSSRQLGVQTDDKKPKVKVDKKDLKRAKGSMRKSEVPTELPSLKKVFKLVEAKVT